MKNTKRGIAFRRHHYNRLKAKRINKHYWSKGYTDCNGWNERFLGMAVNTPKNCSCYMCGNPRKHWKDITLQEKKSLDYFKSQEY